MLKNCKGTEGSAIVELAILLPAYALVILCALYFGYGWLIHQEAAESNMYAAIKPSSQSADIADHFYKAYEGTPIQTEEDWMGRVFWANNPASGNDEHDFHDILQELSYTFWGGFTLVGGRLVWENTGGLNETGEYIEQHNIMSDEHLASMEWIMNDWLTRNTARTRYSWAPSLLGGINAEVGPASGKVTADNRIDPMEIETSTEATVRGTKARPLVSGSLGVSSNIYELTDRFSDAERMPGSPNFGASGGFWNQDRRPDLGR